MVLLFTLVFVGYKTYQDNQRFKPYHQLALELNNELGGGFTISETKHCGLEGPVCPVVNMVYKEQNITTLSVKNDHEAFLSKLNTRYGDRLTDKGCSEFASGLQCNAIALTKNGDLKVTFESNLRTTEILISRQ